MQEGYWINYNSGKTFPIDEHEQWIRAPGNAKKLGVPPNIIKAFAKFKPIKDRDKFLMFLMEHAPIMRVRGHGGYVTFEYSSRSRGDPMDAIWIWAKENAGPLTYLNIINFATRENVSMSFQDFEETTERGGYEAVMRAASCRIFSVKQHIARELLRLSKEILQKS